MQIKQGTKPRMDMVQRKTTDMIEILKLDSHFCPHQLLTAGRPDEEDSSQSALFTFLLLQWLPLLPTVRLCYCLHWLMILVPILHYSSTLQCLWARLCVSQLLNIFKTLFISRALICYRRDREHLPGRSLSALTVHEGKWPGRGTLTKRWNEPEGFFFSAVLGCMWTEQTHVNFVNTIL